MYKANFRGGSLFLEQSSFTYLFYPAEGIDKHHHSGNETEKPDVTFHSLKMHFANASSSHLTVMEEQQSFYYNYFVGSDSKKWASGIPVCKTVIYKDLYQGIDLKIFGRGNNVRYDFIVSPFADPSLIKLKFEGQQRLFLRRGELVIVTSVGEIVQQRPVAFQMENGITREIECEYEVSGTTIGFKIKGNYDKNRPLVIDPTVVFATYTGSLADNWGMSASYDNQGNAYTAGICFNVGYPTTTGAFQTSIANISGYDISISKFNSTGTNLIYSTYLGGNGSESPQSITVDHSYNLVVLGRTASIDYPVTAGVFDGTLNGGTDIVLTKFNSNGSNLLASTFVGGSLDDGVNVNQQGVLSSLKHNYADDGRGAVHVDKANNIYVASCTMSSDFPITPGAYQVAKSGMQDACVFKMNPSLSAMIFSSYLGGTNNDAAYNLALDAQDRPYVTGGTESANFPVTSGVLNPSYLGSIDGFITHFSVGGNSILESSYIGTSAYDQSYFVQLDKNNNVYLYGQSAGSYPVTPGAYSNPNSGQFLHKLDPLLTSTYFSTVFGSGKGTPDIVPSAFLVDNCQNLYISGWGGLLFGQNNSESTTSGLPVTANAFQSSTDGSDFYFAVFSKNVSSLAYGTFFGGNVSREHVDGGTSSFDKAGIVYQAICESCGGNQDMPTTPGVWSNTNGAANCNNAVVKFTMDMKLTVAQLGINPFVTTGCAPFKVNFMNSSINAVQYKWDFGDGTSSTNAVPSHTFVNPGTYTVMLIASDSLTCNMIDTAYITITVNAGTGFPPMSPLTICKGDTANLQVNHPSASSYNWSPSVNLSNPNISNPKAWPLANTIYSVTVADTVCKSLVTNTVMVSVNSNTVTIIKDPKHLCLDDTIKLSASAACASYSWSSGPTTSFLNVTSPGTYSLITTDNNGCKSTDAILVSNFFHVPANSYTYSICEKESIQLWAPEGNYTYEWSPSFAISNTSIYNPVSTPLFNMVYTVIISNGPCISSATHSIYVLPVPVLNVYPPSTLILPGESAQLNASSDCYFYWHPNYELTCSACHNPIVSPEENTVYYCTATTEAGCETVDSVLVNIAPTFYVPNSFTPNGNDLNEVFRPKFTGYDRVEVSIFDRWGELIYYYDDLEGGWDGTYKGSKAELGVYVYKIRAQDYLGNTMERVGSITLLR